MNGLYTRMAFFSATSLDLKDFWTVVLVLSLDIKVLVLVLDFRVLVLNK